MKSIVALSSLALVSLSSISPCLAVNQVLGRSPNPSSSSQPLPDAAKTTLVAGINFGGLINQGLDIVKQEQRRKQEEERKAQLEKERQERLKAEEERKAQLEKERQEHLEAAKKQQEESAAAAAAKREAERKYVERLTPEQRKAYSARKRAQENATRHAEEDFMKMIFGAGMSGGGSSASQQGSMSDQDRWNRDHQQQAPIYQPAPAPVTPIGGDSGIYGSCHNASCP